MRTKPLGLLVAAFLLAACGSTSPSAGPVPTEPPAAVAPATPAPSPSPPPVTRIVFAQVGASSSVVFSVLPNGSGLKKLLTGSYGMPRWSPDGTEIAVSSSSSGVFETIVSADGKSHRDLTSPDRALSLRCSVWSPDGKRLLCEGWAKARGREGLYSVSASSGHDLKRLTTSIDSVHDIPGDYSPDGSRIVFVRATYPPERHGQLWVCDADGGNATKLVDMLVGYRVSWSPDGRRIVGDAGGSLLVFDLKALATEPRTITVPGGAASNARWSPDGSQIVFQLVRSGSHAPEIYTVGADGTTPKQITKSTASDEFPDWGLLPR